MGGVFCTCGACGINSLCVFIITGCRNMHLTEWYVCKTCWDMQKYCSQCAAYAIEWASLQHNDYGKAEWYTSWVESPK